MLRRTERGFLDLLSPILRLAWTIPIDLFRYFTSCTFLLPLCYIILPSSGLDSITSLFTNIQHLASLQPVVHMDLRGRSVMVSIAAMILIFVPSAVSHYHSPSADAAPTVNVDSLFQYTTSRNHKVITQAVDFVVSMQTAPTCTRMAASHLMNECKLLEHAPDFAKSRPEAYLDNVKTEYAAKLAVCELLTAQPVNPVPPPHCDILVPSSRHCGKGGSWWYTQPEVSNNDKQCYPEFKDYQYTQCLKSLQSTPQFWTSFSNARQNSVVMCQASRDAIERENHLEIFKNLTQVLGGVTANMQKTTEEYESLIQEQRQYSEEARDSHQQLKEHIQAVQEKAVSTVGALDEKFHTFMEASISELIAALADSQSNEIDRIHRSMQEFSRHLMAESSQLSKFFTGELQQYHDRALVNIQTNHEAQVDSYNALTSYMDAAQDTINRTDDVAGRSLLKVDSIAQRLDIFETQTEHIAEGFAFLSAIPTLVNMLVRGLVGTIGLLFIFTVLYKFNTRFATYAVGACSSAFLLHTSGVFEWLFQLPSRITNVHAQASFDIIAGMSPTQKGLAMVLLLWFGAYPVCRLNTYLGTWIGAALDRLLGPLWLHPYSNDGGMGYLPCIEIPAAPTRRKRDFYNGE